MWRSHGLFSTRFMVPSQLQLHMLHILHLMYILCTLHMSRVLHVQHILPVCSCLSYSPIPK